MRIEGDFDELYGEACTDLQRLGPVAENLLRELLDASSIQIHSVTHRVKAQSDLKRKIEQKADAYADLGDVHDLLGLRVITFFPDEVDLVSEVVKREFSIDHTNSVDKRSLLDPDRFGYLSVHYVAGLNADRTRLTEHARFKGRKFEIQIRSILQHAWAEIEHDLGYHTPGAIPDSIRRRFSRLAGILEIADDEFRRLREDAEEYQSGVGGEIDKKPNQVPINRDSVAAFIQSSKVVKDLDRDLVNGRDAKLIHKSAGDLDVQANRYVGQLVAAGFSTIGEVEAALTSRSEAIKAFFNAWLDKRVRNQEFPIGISLFYLCYLVVCETKSVEAVRNYLHRADISFSDSKAASKAAKELVQTYKELRLSS